MALQKFLVSKTLCDELPYANKNYGISLMLEIFFTSLKLFFI